MIDLAALVIVIAFVGAPIEERGDNTLDRKLFAGESETDSCLFLPFYPDEEVVLASFCTYPEEIYAVLEY